jgi:hypothetical protein
LNPSETDHRELTALKPEPGVAGRRQAEEQSVQRVTDSTISQWILFPGFGAVAVAAGLPAMSKRAHRSHFATSVSGNRAKANRLADSSTGLAIGWMPLSASSPALA